MSTRRPSRGVRLRRRRHSPLLEALEPRLLLAANNLQPLPSPLGGAVVADAAGPITADNVAPQLEPLVLSTRSVTENGVVIVAGEFSDPDPDSHTVVIDWGGGGAGQPAEGTTRISATQLNRLPNGNWQFSAQHQYLDDNPTGTTSDTYSITATVRDNRGGVSSTDSASSSGNVFVTGHPVMANQGQAGFDVAVLDYLRGAGRANEIARGDYDIGYLRAVDRGAPGAGLFGTVSEASPQQLAQSGGIDAFLGQIDVLYVSAAADIGDAPGALILRAFRQEIETFFNAGGDLFVESSSGIERFYDFLPDSVAVFGHELTTFAGDMTATAEATAIGITDAMIDFHPVHTRFNGFHNDYTVFEARGEDVVSIGLESGLVRVVNVAPALEPLVLDEPIHDEGDQVVLNGTFQDPGERDLHTLVIDWGGGTAGQPHQGTTTLTTAGPNPAGTTLERVGDGLWSFSASHVYSDDNPTETGSDVYLISVTAGDDDAGEDVASVAATIRNVDPTIDSLVPSTFQLASDGNVTVTGTFFDPGFQDAHSIVIDWGGGVLVGQPHEGTTTLTTAGPNPLGTTLVDLGAGQWRFTATHRYANTNTADGDYTITATVSDDDTGSDTATTDVTVNNVPPELQSLEFSATTVSEGELLLVTGQFTDPGLLDQHSVVIDWGGGAPGQPVEGTTTITTAGPHPEGVSLEHLGDGVWSFGAQHRYADDDPTDSNTTTYRITATVTDDRGGADRIGDDPVGGNVFVTGHSVLANDHQEGLDAVVLDYLRGAGRVGEIAREDYDIGYLRTIDRRTPGGGVFGRVLDANPTSFASGVAFAAYLDQIDVLYVPWRLDLGGTTGSAALNSYAAEIAEFYDAGGDLFVEAGAELDTFYDFLPPSVAVTAENLTANTGFAVTAEGTAIGITNLMVNGTDSAGNGFEIRNRFTDVSDNFVVFEVLGSSAVSMGLQSRTTSGGLPITVNNVAPQLAPLGFTTSEIGPDGTLTMTGTIIDPGLRDTHTVQIDWGDSATRPVEETLTTLTTNGPNPAGTSIVDNGDGTWSFTATHRYLLTPTAPDSYSIGVQVSDDDLGTGAETATVLVSNLPPVLEPLILDRSPIAEGGTIAVTGTFADSVADTHTIVIDWGGGTSGQVSEGTTTITTQGPNPSGAELQALGGGRWAFSAQHTYLDDSPTSTALDPYSITATVSDGRGGTSRSQAATQGGNLFLTGHSVLRREGQAGLDVVILDYLRGAGSDSEIARDDYDVGYLRSIDRGAPGGGLFTSVIEAEPTSFTDGVQFADFLSQIDVLYIPWALDVDGGTGSAAINTFADQIQNFFAAGGDIAVESGADLETFYDFLTPLVSVAGTAVSGTSGFSATIAGAAIGITDVMLSGYELHSHFTEFDEEFVVLERRGPEVISIGRLSPGALVQNVAPIVDQSSLTAEPTGAGNTFTLTGEFSDPGLLDSFTVVIDWGGVPGGTTTIRNGGPNPPGSELIHRGNGNWSFSAEHAYSAAAVGEVTISIAVLDDDGGEDSATTVAKFTNAPPELDSLVVDRATIDEHSAVTLTGRFFDAGLEDTHTVVVDWGGGSLAGQPAEGTTTITAQGSDPAGATLRDLGDGNWEFTAVHQYLNDNPTSTSSDEYLVTATVTDNRLLQTTGTTTVVVRNVAPEFNTLQLNATTIDEDGSVIVSGTFTDPGLSDTHTVEIDWGGGSEAQPHEGTTTITSAGAREVGPEGTTAVRPRKRFRRLTNLGGGQWAFAATHQYLDDRPTATSVDSYNITIKVIDSDTGTDTRNETITVRNVAPQVKTLVLDHPTITENGAVVLSGTFTDPRLSDTHQVVIDWGVAGETTTIATAGGNPAGTTLTSLGAGNWSFSATHLYRDDDPSVTAEDTYTIMATVTDDDGGSHAATETVVVSNSPPQLTSLQLSGPRLGADGTLTVTGVFADPGVLDTHTVVIDWGTATTTTLTTAGPNPAGTVLTDLGNGSWEFTAANQYSVGDTAGKNNLMISATVSDDDSGVDSDILTVPLDNELPVVSPLTLSATAIPEGGQVSVFGTFRDLDLTDTHTVVIDWGGGTGGQPHEGTTTITAAGSDPPGATLRTLGGGNWSFSATHLYPDDNPSGVGADDYFIRATVTDSGLGSDSEEVRLSVNDVGPVVAAPVLSATAIDENGTVAISGQFSDVGLLDTHTVVIDWSGGEFGQPEGTTTLTTLGPNPPGTTLTEVSEGNWSFTATHQYLDDQPSGTQSDNQTIVVTVTDDDSVSGTGVASVLVRNLNPVIDDSSLVLGGLQGNHAVVGVPMTISAAFTDVGTLDPHNVFINWNDGETSNTASSATRADFLAFQGSGGGSGSFTAQHVFDRTGLFLVSIFVSDDDLGTTFTTVNVVVAPAATGLTDSLLAELERPTPSTARHEHETSSAIPLLGHRSEADVSEVTGRVRLDTAQSRGRGTSDHRATEFDDTSVDLLADDLAEVLAADVLGRQATG